jgi:hypothetical protein
MRDVGETLGDDEDGKIMLGKYWITSKKQWGTLGGIGKTSRATRRSKYDSKQTIEMDNEMLQGKWKESCKKIRNEKNGERERDGEKTMQEYILRWKTNVGKLPTNTWERKKSSKNIDAKDGVKWSHHVHEHHEMQWTWLVHQKIGVMINIMCEQSYF